MRGAIRGAALAETALVVSVGFTMLWAGIELGVIGYQQLLADGGAFMYAHRAALGDTQAQQKTQTAFPGIANGGTMQTQALPPDDTTVPVDFGFDQNARHGGVSLVRGQHLQATIDRTPVAGLQLSPDGGTVHVTAAFIEPRAQTFDYGFNLPGTGYNSSASNATARDYFADDQNVPPYDIGFRFVRFCPDNQWDQNCGGNTYRSLDSAETLDQNNWTLPVGAGTGQMFQEMGFHQRTYAAISQSLPDVAPTPQADGSPPVAFDETNASSLICTPYSWDVAVAGGYPLGVKTVGSYPWHGMNKC